jgi:hypothetical protein
MDDRKQIDQARLALELPALSRRRFAQGAVVAGGALAAGIPASPAVVAQDATAEQFAEGDPGFVLQAPEGDPQRGGSLRLAFNAATANYDLFQGGSFPVMCHIYNGLVRENLMDGLQTIVPDLATS